MDYKERQRTVRNIVDRITNSSWEMLTDEEINMIVGVLELADKRILFKKDYKESIEGILKNRTEGVFKYE